MDQCRRIGIGAAPRHMLVGTDQRERRLVELAEAGGAQVEYLERHARGLRGVGDRPDGGEAGLSQHKQAQAEAEMIVERGSVVEPGVRGEAARACARLKLSVLRGR